MLSHFTLILTFLLVLHLLILGQTAKREYSIQLSIPTNSWRASVDQFWFCITGTTDLTTEWFSRGPNYFTSDSTDYSFSISLDDVVTTSIKQLEIVDLDDDMVSFDMCQVDSTTYSAGSSTRVNIANNLDTNTSCGYAIVDFVGNSWSGSTGAEPCPYNISLFFTSAPSPAPSGLPTRIPSSVPTSDPSGQPTNQPTAMPTNIPTEPSLPPTMIPSKTPTAIPTDMPTFQPTDRPTRHPTLKPTDRPTRMPTFEPSDEPTQVPSKYPSYEPSLEPSNFPTEIPTTEPSFEPSLIPTSNPTNLPSTIPSFMPTNMPSQVPTEPTQMPSIQPSAMPSFMPSSEPTPMPSQNPTFLPTLLPTNVPTITEESNVSQNQGLDDAILAVIVVAGCLLAAVMIFGVVFAIRKKKPNENEKNVTEGAGDPEQPPKGLKDEQKSIEILAANEFENQKGTFGTGGAGAGTGGIAIAAGMNEGNIGTVATNANVYYPTSNFNHLQHGSDHNYAAMALPQAQMTSITENSTHEGPVVVNTLLGTTGAAVSGASGKLQVLSASEQSVSSKPSVAAAAAAATIAVTPGGPGMDEDGIDLNTDSEQESEDNESSEEARQHVMQAVMATSNVNNPNEMNPNAGHVSNISNVTGQMVDNSSNTISNVNSNNTDNARHAIGSDGTRNDRYISSDNEHSDDEKMEEYITPMG